MRLRRRWLPLAVFCCAAFALLSSVCPAARCFTSRRERVLVIGAGSAGLAAAADLSRFADVVVLEAQVQPHWSSLDRSPASVYRSVHECRTTYRSRHRSDLAVECTPIAASVYPSNSAPCGFTVRRATWWPSWRSRLAARRLLVRTSSCWSTLKTAELSDRRLCGMCMLS